MKSLWSTITYQNIYGKDILIPCILKLTLKDSRAYSGKTCTMRKCLS